MPENLTILERRRIEALIVKPIYQVLTRDFGLETANKIISEAIENDAQEAGRREAALEEGPTDLATFKAILPNWSRGGALDIEVIEATSQSLCYDVTRCQYATMYKEMGMLDLGFLLSCGRDGAYMKGYAPEVEMIRTQTIMTGSSRCDFRYQLKKSK
ncbi:MAG: L-2-amino-thiazoline-4-carboxylic acid hydrolase [Deltaproteobacteria bacterium]|jgi:hypothetical protein|nr:L-2-amino-thiazoline-4-carboxylic acid hydrolase [Deltaproteobacteria bacterium]